MAGVQAELGILLESPMAGKTMFLEQRFDLIHVIDRIGGPTVAGDQQPQNDYQQQVESRLERTTRHNLSWIRLTQ